MECIACQIEGCRQPMKTTEHHLNLDGKAGQKRRGDEYSIPLCEWHHHGYPAKGEKADTMAHQFGPSLALSSKMFRFTYGSDDQLLALTNLKLQAVA
jgi:hypothetical protein